MWSKLRRPKTGVGIGGVIVASSYFLAESFSGGFSMTWPLSIGQWASISGIAAGVGLIIWGLFKDEADMARDNPLEDIKQDLVTMNTIERNTATEMSTQLELPKETVIEILEDCQGVLDNCLSKSISICLEKDYDTLITYCHTVGKILDANKVGLKSALINNEVYKASKLELEQKRLRLKPAKRHKLAQSNIVRVEELSYGVNSFIMLRGMLGKFQGYTKGTPIDLRLRLEGIEDVSGAMLKAMLDDLEGDWSKEKKK